MKKTILLFLAAYATPTTLYASDDWVLMSRQKQCTEIAAVAKELPILQGIKTPEDLVDTYKKKGINPIVDTKLSSMGYVNVSAAYGEVSLTFSKRENCKTIVGGPK